MRRALLVASIVLSGTISAAHGCDCGKKAATPARGSAAPERDVPGVTRTVPVRPPRDLRDLPKGDVRRSAPITLEEAQAAMPALEGARAMGAPAVAPTGAQARTSYCIDAQNQAEASMSVTRQLEAAGWKRLTQRPPEDGAEPAQYTVVGEKGALRVSATVLATRRTGCDMTVNQYFTVIAIQKIASDAAAPADAGP